MKKSLLLIFVLLCNYGWGQVMFQKTYRDTADLDGYYISKTSDKKYVLTGAMRGIGIPFMKLDSLGNILQFKRFPGGSGNSIQETHDGGFIIGGDYINSYGLENTYDAALIKTNSSGDTLWTRRFDALPGPSGCDDHCLSAQQTADGGYMICGNSNCAEEIFLAKTDSSGTILWAKYYQGGGSQSSTHAMQTTDGGFIISGSGDNAAVSSIDSYLIKTDANGIVQWARTFGGAGSDYANWVEQTSDGGFIVAGYTNSFGAGSNDVYLIKITSSGTVSWAKTYGGSLSDVAFFVKQANDGGYLVLGQTKSFGVPNTHIYLIKTNSAGNVLWSKSYGNNDKTVATSLEFTDGGGYLITGWTLDTISDFISMYLIKTDSLGNSGCNEMNVSTIVSNQTTSVSANGTAYTFGFLTARGMSIIEPPLQAATLCYIGIDEIKSNKLLISIYPNPAHSEFVVNSSDFRKERLEIYDITGREVYQTTLSSKLQTLNPELSAGVYLVKVSDGEKVFTQKLVVE